jgi:hypothetical protein
MILTILLIGLAIYEFVRGSNAKASEDPKIKARAGRDFAIGGACVVLLLIWVGVPLITGKNW